MLRAVTARAAPLALACLLLAGGCGGDDQAASAEQHTVEEVLAAVEGLGGEELTAKLAELAKAEGGRLQIYTSLSDEIGEEIANRFGDEYDVDVSIYAGNSNDVAQRLSEETKAGRHNADLVEIGTPVLIALGDEGMLAKGLPVDTDGIAEEVVDEGWVAVRHNRFAVSWNTKIVTPGTEPKRWEDLADPRWDGKLALELEEFDWYATLRRHWLGQGKSEQEVDRLFEAMADGAKVIKGHSLLGQLTASGEVGVAASNFSHIVDRSTKDGAPITWKPVVEPAFLRAQGMGIAASSRRPATAALFIQWALTKGQELYAQNGWVPARTSLQSREGFEQVLVDVKSIAADEKRWVAEYERLVRRGTIVAED
jgi:iron(III) transport system substrate-binding protein